MRYNKLAKEILSQLGGTDNIIQSGHCITRLRFTLINEKNIDIDKISKLDGVLGAQFQSGQFQIIIGNEVSKVYNELAPMIGEKENAKKKTYNKNFFNQAIETLAGIFTPFLPAITGAGFMKGILALLSMGLINPQGDLYAVLNLIADAPFYFLPFFVAISTAQKFKTNIFLALIIPAAMMYPTILSPAEGVSSLNFLGLPIPLISYATAVIPVILGVILLGYVYKKVDKIVPNMLKIILTPLLVMVIMIPITLIAIGPLGNYIGIGVERGISFLFDKIGIFGGLVFGGTLPLIVMTGMHYAFFPPTFMSLGKFGYDKFLLPFSIITNFAQAGATFAVFFKTKNKKIKALSASTGVSALFGITEPAMYGINLKFKKPFYAVLIGGAISGAFITLVDLKVFGFGLPGLMALPTYISKEYPNNFINLLIGLLISFGLAFTLTLLFKFDTGEESTMENKDTKAKEINIFAPMTGKLIPLSEVPDETFSKEFVGKGCAIIPSDGLVKSPLNGKISMIPESKHAIGIISDDGVEIFIHIGLETVSMQGKPFTIFVKEGDDVIIGQELMKVDLEYLKKENVTSITPIIITNSNTFEDISMIKSNDNTVHSVKDKILIAIKK